MIPAFRFGAHADLVKELEKTLLINSLATAIENTRDQRKKRASGRKSKSRGPFLYTVEQYHIAEQLAVA